MPPETETFWQEGSKHKMGNVKNVMNARFIGRFLTFHLVFGEL